MFFGPIKAAVSAVAAAGLGAFTPSTAFAGALAFSTVPAHVNEYLIRAEEGATWELFYSWWNGTTLTRSATQLVDSSSGSQITFTTAATVAIVPDPLKVMPRIGSIQWGVAVASAAASTLSVLGHTAAASIGTAGGVSPTTSDFCRSQVRLNYTSATTANALAGFTSTTNKSVFRSTTAFMGGFHWIGTFGYSGSAVTGPRVQCGLMVTPMTTGEPSAGVNQATFSKDSTDTNIQFMVNDGSGAATKQDTGIPFALNAVYKARIWCPPGPDGGPIRATLVRLDTGDIWHGSASSNLPAVDTLMGDAMQAGLSATTGTAMTFCVMVAALQSRL